MEKKSFFGKNQLTVNMNIKPWVLGTLTTEYREADKKEEEEEESLTKLLENLKCTHLNAIPSEELDT